MPVPRHLRARAPKPTGTRKLVPLSHPSRKPEIQFPKINKASLKLARKNARYQRDPATLSLSRMLDNAHNAGISPWKAIRDSDRYDMLEDLGSGSFHDVVKVSDKLSGHKFAVRIPKEEAKAYRYQPNPMFGIQGSRLFHSLGLTVPDSLTTKGGVSIQEVFAGSDLEGNLHRINTLMENDPELAEQWLRAETAGYLTGRFDTGMGRNLALGVDRKGVPILINYDLDLLFTDSKNPWLMDWQVSQSAIKAVGGQEAAKRIVDDSINRVQRTVKAYKMDKNIADFVQRQINAQDSWELYDKVGRGLASPTYQYIPAEALSNPVLTPTASLPSILRNLPAPAPEQLSFVT